MGSYICFTFNLLLRIVLIEAYEENSASHKYVVNIRRVILIVFSDNCGYLSLILYLDSMNDSFVKISHNVYYINKHFLLSYIKTLGLIICMGLVLVHDFVTLYVWEILILWLMQIFQVLTIFIIWYLKNYIIIIITNFITKSFSFEKLPSSLGQ